MPSASLEKKGQNATIFGQHQESITFYQNPPQIEDPSRKESQQTVHESPILDKPSPINLSAKEIEKEA